MINSNTTLSQYSEISYLKESEIGYKNNKFGHWTSYNYDHLSINKCLLEEKRHITTTKKEILNHDIGFMILKKNVKDQI